MPKQTIIDTHVHVFPERIVEHAIETLCLPGRQNKVSGRLDDMLAAMKAAQVKQSWTIPVATRPTQIDSILEFAVYQRDLPGSPIVPLGSIHPDNENPREILTRIRDLGLPGIKIHPDYQNVRPTDARMLPIYDAATDLGLILYFHAGDDDGPRTAYGSPQEFDALIKEYPRLRMVLAHMGGYKMWDEVEEVLIGKGSSDRVYFDTSSVLGRISKEQLARMMQAIGMQRILFGSDSPWTNIADDIAYFANLGFAQADLENLFHRNATRLLNSVQNSV